MKLMQRLQSQPGHASHLRAMIFLLKIKQRNAAYDITLLILFIVYGSTIDLTKLYIFQTILLDNFRRYPRPGIRPITNKT